MKELLVIIGAGASADSADASARPNNQFRPPLSRELFRIDERPAVAAILDAYPGAQALAPDLAEKSRASTISIERELSKLANHQSTLIREHFKDIPRYLSSLLTRVSRDFINRPGGYVRLAKSLLADHPHQVTFVSLNYDDLLEKGLRIFDPDYSFLEIEDYVNEDRAAKLIKPHGSINWFTGSDSTGIPGANDSSGQEPASTEPNEPPIIVTYQNDVPMNLNLYPVLTAPMIGKSDKHLRCPPNHIEVFAESCKSARKLLLIGTSGLDENILGVVGENIGMLNTYHIVSRGDAMEVRDRVQESGPMIDGELAVLYNDGFREYLGSEEFQQLLQA